MNGKALPFITQHLSLHPSPKRNKSLHKGGHSPRITHRTKYHCIWKTRVVCCAPVCFLLLLLLLLPQSWPAEGVPSCPSAASAALASWQALRTQADTSNPSTSCNNKSPPTEKKKARRTSRVAWPLTPHSSPRSRALGPNHDDALARRSDVPPPSHATQPSCLGVPDPGPF